MNTEIDERGRRFITTVNEFKQNNPYASRAEINRYIEKTLENAFGDTLPPEQKNSFAAFGRACWRC